MPSKLKVAIVDYGLGNLFSVKHACGHAGLDAAITSDRDDIFSSRAVILPGVGAFRDAMEALVRQDLVAVLKDVARSGTPLIGICLGMQLLMSESQEFGSSPGLGIVDGDVVRLEDSEIQGRRLKVPHIGWSRIEERRHNGNSNAADRWRASLIEEVPEGSFMYFVHSYYARPVDPEVILSTTRYGPIDFCSSFRKERVFGCQFHPERSGPLGLRVYHQLYKLLTSTS